MADELSRRVREQENPAWLRQRADRARELAGTLPIGDGGADRLNDYAAELEAQARAIDKGRD